MKILVITNMHPSHRKDIDFYGIFVMEQVRAIEKNSNVTCEIFPIDGYNSKLEYIKSIPKIIKKINHGNYDIIHIHYGLSGVFLLAGGLKNPPPIVITLHGGDILIKQNKWFQVFLTKLIIKKADAVITLNDEMVGAASNACDCIETIPCGVDSDFFSGTRTTSIPAKITFAGDPSRWVKNFPLFQSVMQSYIEKYGNIEIATLGNLNRDQIRELLLSTSVLVMTSHSEGSPQIIKEALSCDTAIVASDVGDLRKILGGTPGTAIFEASAPPNKIAEKIHNVMHEQHKTPGARRNRVFELGIDQRDISLKVLSIYQRVIKNPAQKGTDRELLK